MLPPKYSPLQKTGNGNQCVYLTDISREMAKYLIKKIESENSQIEVELDRIEEDLIEKEIYEDQNLINTEKEAIVKSRRGQGIFRDKLEKIEKKCRISNICNPKYLIASHIKPWKHCEPKECLDGENGLLLSPNIDHLFDRGYISFKDNGDLIISDFADYDSLHKMGISTEDVINVGEFTKKQQYYLEYHREHILKRI